MIILGLILNISVFLSIDSLASPQKDLGKDFIPEIVYVEPIFSGEHESGFLNFFKTRFANDASKRKIEIGYERIESSTWKDGHKRYFFKTISNDNVSAELRRSLVTHPALLEFYKMRKKAHEISGYQDNSKIYISFSDKGMFNLGPVFVDSTRFLIHDYSSGRLKLTETQNLVTFEKAKLFHLEVFSIDQLLMSGYLPFIAAHEFAHSLMQDIYGIKGIENVLSRHHSTAGHDVMLTSDPYVAFVEGFAEAFESYLYEKTHPFAVKKSEFKYDEPFLLYLFNRFGRGVGGWDRFAESILLFAGDHLGNYLMSHLRDTRVTPVIKNQYLAESPLGIEVLEKNFVFEEGIDSVLKEHTFVSRPQRVLAREGVIAHVFYSLLKNGEWERIVTVMSKYKPIHMVDFYSKYVKEYPASHEYFSGLMFASFSNHASKIQEDIYNNYRLFWEFNRSSLNSVKEDLIIIWARPLNAKQFRQYADDIFPDLGVYDLTYQYNFNDDYLNERIKNIETKIRSIESSKFGREEDSIIPTIFTKNPQRHNGVISKAYRDGKFDSLESFKAYENEMKQKYLFKQTLHQAKLTKKIAEANANGFKAFRDELAQLPKEIWLTSKNTGVASRMILEKSIERIDLNTATRFELAWFLMGEHRVMMYQKSGFYDKDHAWPVRFIMAWEIEKKIKLNGFTGNDVGDAYEIADLIINERESRPNKGFKSFLDLKNLLPPVWYSSLLTAYGTTTSD